MRKRCVVLLGAAVALGLGFGLGACASVHNLPLNTPTDSPLMAPSGQAAAALAASQKAEGDGSGAAIGLAFSGGGTRAAAFAYGVLGELARTPAPRKGNGDLLDRVGVVSGVSGGSIIAAYYGLKGRAALTDFRQQFLTQDVMAALDTKVTLVNLGRALGGGLNTDNRLRDWFNDHLYHHATFGALLAKPRPIVLINATDVYDRTPFLFVPQTFAAACSDITKYPIAAGVAASAAVPAAFAPVIIEAFPDKCHAPLPPWIVKAANDPAASPLVHSFAKGMEQIHSGKVKYVKLFDGGLIDNFGLSGLTILRAAQDTPYGPMRPAEAVNLRRFLFLVVDAGQSPKGNWSKTLDGPSGKELVGAVVDVLVDANAHASYAAFEATMNNWRNSIVRWRCGLSRAEVARLRGGRTGRWSCSDLKITVARVSFGELGAARAAKLNQVPTSLTLPVEDVDELTQAGADALKANPAYQKFLRDM
jgi:NTE family protein